MNNQLIGSQAVKLLSQLIGQNLTVSDITPQVIFMADLIALLKGVIHADQQVGEDEIIQFRNTLNKLDLTNKQTVELSKLLLSGIQRYKLHSAIDDFLVLLVPLSEAEKLLLFGLGYRMAMADSTLDNSESKYLRNLAGRLGIESRYLDVLESSFSGKPYNSKKLQELCDLVDPAQFRDLGAIFVNAADSLLTSLNQISGSKDQEAQTTSFITTTSANSEYQKLQNFQSQKQSLLNRIDHLSQLIDDGIQESLLPVTFRDDIQSVKDRLESQRFRVAVIGEFSQGKSTLLNALLGEEIQPVRAIPCSGTISVLKYGKTKRVICRYRDRSEEEISIEQYRDKVSISKEAALNNRSEELLNSNIVEIIFEHPNLLLCRNGVEIVDSPGLNEHPDRTRVTEELLKETDAILFMTNANKLLTQGERDMIRKIKEREGNQPLENLFLVVNFMDSLDNDEDRQDVQIAANSIVKDGSITGNERIHFVSAKLALKATLNRTSDEYLTTFAAFTRALENFLTDERGSVMLQSVTQNLNEIKQACVNELSSATNNVNTSLSISDKHEILERIGEASGRFVTIRKMLEFLRNQTIQSALESWQISKASFKAKVTERSQYWKTDHNPIFSRDALIQDYVAQFSLSLQDEINSWANSQLNNTILPPKLNLLDRAIKEELDALNASFADLDGKIGTSFSDNFQPVFRDFDVAYVAGFAAGGVGVGGGAAAAAFFLIPALALGPAIIAGVIAAALFGGGAAAAAMVDAYKQIANQICKSGFDEFEKSGENITEKIEESINSPFMDRAYSVDKLIKQIISECENRLEQEERKHQESVDRLRFSISSKKQEFEKSLSS
jgi:GTPase Era involved in 16S rRNA processing/uncharacterized tellurite resistance protein B-like protein